MSFAIKQFGNDHVDIGTAEELHDVIKNDYANSSVSIITTLPSGIKKPTPVDVDDHGNMTNTYTNQPFLSI